MISFNNLSNSFTSKSATIKKLIEVLDEAGLQIALVLEGQELIGVVTDGDIRRYLLRYSDFNQASVSDLMNTDFTFVSDSAKLYEVKHLMRSKQIHQIPVLDENRNLIGLYHIDNMDHFDRYADNPVVIMAGGLGQRLHPYTLDVPKPMLPVNGQPMIESLINKLSHLGFNNIYISINYMGEQIEDHFGDGSEFGVSINYLRETSPMGTAGSLSLLPSVDKSVLILNGDVVTNLDFSRVIRYHEKSSALATVCLRNHEVQIPYAVARSSGKSILELTEKPTYTFSVNAGIYVLSPEILTRIPSEKFDMPELLNGVLNDGLIVNGFPMHESWRDVGTPDDYKEVQSKS